MLDLCAEPYRLVNFLMEQGEERIRQAYGPEKDDRVKALKGARESSLA